MRQAILGVLAAGVFTGQAYAQPAMPEGITLYAGGDLTFTGLSNILGGDTVAGGSVLHQGSVLTVESIFGGGGFQAQPAAFQNSSGEWYFNGDIVDLGGPGSELRGSVRSTAGNIDFLDSGQDVFGDVVAAGNIDWQFSLATIYGDVIAGGLATVTPNVTGTITSGATVNLPTFAPTALPAGRNLAPSGNNITTSAFTDDFTLAPGVYGDLLIDNRHRPTLTAGSYVFNSVTSTSSLRELGFDTSGGQIDVYVANDVDLDLIQVIDGERLFVGGSPDPQAARDIFIESGGHFELGMNFFGTIFAPNGDFIANSFADVTGRVIAGGDVVLTSSDVVFPELLVTGDLNGDGTLTNGDISPFVLALTDPTGFAATFPDSDPDVLGDFSGDGLLTNGDISGFVAALTGGGSASISLAAVPEPTSFSLLAIGGLLVVRRRSR